MIDTEIHKLDWGRLTTDPAFPELPATETPLDRGVLVAEIAVGQMATWFAERRFRAEGEASARA